MQGDSRAVSARVIRDGDAWAADRSSPLALPLLILLALMSAGLVVYAAGNWALGAGFGAALLAGAALLGWYRRLYPQEVAVGEAVPDWTVARAAADASNMAIAVTDRAGRLVRPLHEVAGEVDAAGRAVAVEPERLVARRGRVDTGIDHVAVAPVGRVAIARGWGVRMSVLAVAGWAAGGEEQDGDGETHRRAHVQGTCHGAAGAFVGLPESAS